MAAILVGEEPYSIYPAVSESSNRPDFIGNFIIKAPTLRREDSDERGTT